MSAAAPGQFPADGGAEVAFAGRSNAGKSSAINAMVYIRGHAFDYDQWAALGATGWSYAEVLPFFKRSEGNERGADDFHMRVAVPQKHASV